MDENKFTNIENERQSLLQSALSKNLELSVEERIEAHENARKLVSDLSQAIEESTLLKLPDNPTLTDLQKYVIALEKERGFDHQDVLSKCLLLGEEVGELFKAIRKQSNIAIDPKSKTTLAQEELADILIMLCSIANRLDINLEKAFRDKEEINKTRVWK